MIRTRSIPELHGRTWRCKGLSRVTLSTAWRGSTMSVRKMSEDSGRVPRGGHGGRGQIP
jgi:hypothetical protein